MNDIIHLADESRGRDVHDDVIYAMCGQIVKLGDMRHWYGMPSQVNCPECLKCGVG